MPAEPNPATIGRFWYVCSHSRDKGGAVGGGGFGGDEFLAAAPVGRLEDLALDEDRETVTRLFQLMRQVVTELAPDFQIIVSDHADLPHPWYQASVRYPAGSA